VNDTAVHGIAGLSTGNIYVQYGCGLCAPNRWMNFDASPRLRLEQVAGVRSVLRATVGLVFPTNIRFGDIVAGLPIPDGSARGVYCSHVLEHLPRNDMAPALRNTLRILLPGGLFRLVVPDLHWRAARYLGCAEQGNPTAARDFIESCALGMRERPKTIMSILRNRFSRSAHLWMYDFAALKALLEQAGFAEVRRCSFGDCSDPMFADVEDKGRFFDSGERELAIEAVRPAERRSVSEQAPAADDWRLVR
jgi:SAM-dependent methyltransferase